MSKIYIDLATRFGWASLSDNGTIESGWVDLSKDNEKIWYASSQKRKTLPEGGKWSNLTHYENGRYYRIYEVNGQEWLTLQSEDTNIFHLRKEKQITSNRDYYTQLEKLDDWLHIIHSKFQYDDVEYILEAPAIPMKQAFIGAIKKQFALYAIVDMFVGKHKEITPNEWFNDMCDTFPHLKVWTEGKNSKKVDRKKTSKAIASYLMKKEIKDDNEADAINMMFYDNRELLEDKRRRDERITNSI